MNGRERVERHLAGEAVDRLPVMPITMMVAADQSGVTYGEYATDYRVMADAQARVAERFGFDYVSVISDPAIEAADCGAVIEYYDDQPPAVKESQARLANPTDLAGLKCLGAAGGGRMENRVKAVAALAERVGDEYLVEGWVEGPCAEGSDLRGINNLMLDFLDEPEFVRDLFEFIVEMGTAFAQAQVAAGARLIGIGDAAASLVGPTIYEEFVWAYEQRMVDAIHAMGAKVRLHICGQTTSLMPLIGRLGCEIVDLDSMVSIADARQAAGAEQVFLGNLDPVTILHRGTAADVTRELGECHAAAGARYIIGAGCEIPRGTPDENIFAFRAYSEAAARF